MPESRCGLCCSKCEYYYRNTAKMTRVRCRGCLESKCPVFSDHCRVQSCCEKYGLEHCGECRFFPCELLIEFAYDKHHGDDGKRLDQCRAWVREKQKSKQRAGKKETGHSAVWIGLAAGCIAGGMLANPVLGGCVGLVCGALLQAYAE